MVFNYNSPDRDQLLLLPPAVKDWLPESHHVWFVLDAVTFVDTTRFHDRHPNDGVGRAAYHPDMMLALLIYAYCCGMRSSRRIEAACRIDLAFRAITVQLVPAYVAIARFRVDHKTRSKPCSSTCYGYVIGLVSRAWEQSRSTAQRLVPTPRSTGTVPA